MVPQNCKYKPKSDFITRNKTIQLSNRQKTVDTRNTTFKTFRLHYPIAESQCMQKTNTSEKNNSSGSALVVNTAVNKYSSYKQHHPSTD